jgi:phospholipase D-like protein
MLLLGALFALFISGFWVYCLVDVALTPSNEFQRLPKWAWIAFVVGTFVIGAVIWLAVRRPAQPTAAPRPSRPGGPDGLGGGHPGNERPRPAGQAGARTASRPEPGPERVSPPRGPDDDPDFLRSLDQAIHGDGPAVG